MFDWFFNWCDKYIKSPRNEIVNLILEALERDTVTLAKMDNYISWLSEEEVLKWDATVQPEFMRPCSGFTYTYHVWKIDCTHECSGLHFSIKTDRSSNTSVWCSTDLLEFCSPSEATKIVDRVVNIIKQDYTFLDKIAERQRNIKSKTDDQKNERM